MARFDTELTRFYGKLVNNDTVPLPGSALHDTLAHDPVEMENLNNQRSAQDVLVETLRGAPGGIPHVGLTEIVQSQSGPLHLYTDTPFALMPWDAAAFTWRKAGGNPHIVFVTNVHRELFDDFSIIRRLPEPERAAWCWMADVYLPTEQGLLSGPCGRVSAVIGHDGLPLDYHYQCFIDLSKIVPDHRMAGWRAKANSEIIEHDSMGAWWILQCTWPVMLGLSLLNCRNVETRESARTRAERRREERLLQPGMARQTHIVVKPSGKNSRSGGGSGDGYVPLTSVRGHMRHYGNCCPGAHEPHGKLFGQHSGRVWVPQFARGHEDDGQINHHEYEVRTK